MSLIRSTGAEARHEKVEAEPEGGEHNMQMGTRGSSRVESSGWGGGGENWATYTAGGASLSLSGRVGGGRRRLRRQARDEAHRAEQKAAHSARTPLMRRQRLGRNSQLVEQLAAKV